MREKDIFFFIFTQLKSRFCFVCCLIFSYVSPSPPAPESSTPQITCCFPISSSSSISM